MWPVCIGRSTYFMETLNFSHNGKSRLPYLLYLLMYYKNAEREMYGLYEYLEHRSRNQAAS